MRKKVGILGGTFNPPHIGHLIIANEVLEKLGLQEVWFMPNGQPPHKEQLGESSNNQRVQMTQFAIESNPKFQIELLELERSGPSYTVDTMQLLTEKNPDTDFYFIIGGDMVESLSTWYKIDELAKLVTFVGVNRPGYSLTTDLDILFVEVPIMEISSSMIRTKRNERKSVKYLVTDPVLNYLEEESLYEPF
ncbi:nicotinate-nucleotide adenylyltransferase [Bacillus sp. 2205SS5-2]|uniref:nicotinate-nucleotide adenylyltransferase n=1 Tax=Bacillus sp. 2205SS5-2 TaxID=3109031 RepID=UPI0030044BE9